MKKYSVKRDGKTFTISNENNDRSEIIFDENNIEATLSGSSKTLRVERDDATKNMVLKENGKALFTFKFDYIWGGAEIVTNGVDTGYDIKGRWFKPGTRLTNENDKDLIIATKKDDGLEVVVVDENIDPTMVLATIYYHIYSSGSKMLSVLIGNISH
ncbi:hypothetical protein [Flavobacterium sp.]|uniref:hypothetical protein n=1 Tax=Flavobacterium sp. TaxID=239 RepID=UPI0028BD67B5|nr:hypothetical protein [Flavobacterium sp.]